MLAGLKPRRRHTAGWWLTMLSSKFQDGGEAVARKLRAVVGGRRQSAERGGYLLRCNARRLLRAKSLYQLRKDGTRGHGRDAALRHEASLNDSSALEAHRQPQNIPAHRIRDFGHGCGSAELARVARVLEMVEHLL
jgi:hypothetical protein